MVRKTNIEGQFDTYITIEQAKSELTERQLELLQLGMMVFTLFFIYNKTI